MQPDRISSNFPELQGFWMCKWKIGFDSSTFRYCQSITALMLLGLNPLEVKNNKTTLKGVFQNIGDKADK